MFGVNIFPTVWLKAIIAPVQKGGNQDALLIGSVSIIRENGQILKNCLQI